MKKYICIVVVAAGLIPWCSETAARTRKNAVPDSLRLLQIPIGGDTLRMRYVEGDMFLMGATSEQRSEGSTDRPVHSVAVGDYYIAETEVTQAMWKAVMPDWQIMDEWHNPHLPMTDISWYDAQAFVRRLDSITGMAFRLPTEAEWEFAARGGKASKGFRFAGGNIADSIGWGLSNAGFRKHPVAQKRPNELWLYDMTGNVSEWCEDWYAPYTQGVMPNPQGPDTGQWKIHRGGSFDNCEANRHISFRWYSDPHEATNYCGMRVVLTVARDSTAAAEEEPALVRKIRVGKRSVRMLYVPAETPYYIAESDVTCAQWRRVMQGEVDGRGTDPVLDVMPGEWDTFLEQCRRESKQSLAFATEEEFAAACALDVITPRKQKARKPKRWEKDTQSIQRHRRNVRRANAWTEMLGIHIDEPEDPILQTYTDKRGNTQPMRLVIRL